MLLAAALVNGESKSETATEALRKNFNYINSKVLAMAEDFPADKYSYKLRPEMRSFAAVIVHVASGNLYAAKAGEGQKVSWSEQDPARYHDKAECVALLKNP